MIPGEVTPLIVSFFLGILFGTQIGGQVDKKSLAAVVFLGICASYVLGPFLFFSTPIGGLLAPGLAFSNTFLGALAGLLVGMAARGGEKR